MGMWMIWLTASGVAQADDVRDLANAWKVAHNEAIDLSEAGKSAEALALAKKAAALAPDSLKTRPLILLAELAGEEKDYIVALNALDELLVRDGVPWGVFYNGSITARNGGYAASAYRYSAAALSLAGSQQSFVAPVTVYSALDLGLLDQAIDAAGYLDPKDETHLRAALVRDLVFAGRCDEAREIATPMSADEEREELLATCG